jgi:phosphoenolpyruvate-protein kinase (PTS system EI component)
VGALIARDIGLVEAARQAATATDPLRAIHDAIEDYARMLESLSEETLRERAADVRQVGRRVVERIVHAGTGVDGRPATRRFVLVAAEVGPADLLEHLGQGLVAAVTVRGGANSHAAIVARSVGLPLVTGVNVEILDVPDNTSLLVDADAGVVVAEPDEADVVRTEQAALHDRRRRLALAAQRGLPHLTADGEPFLLLCNVASDLEVRLGRDSGAVGVGLLRTELPFLAADRWPVEVDHRRALRAVFAEAAGWPVTVRLLDFTNDKVPPFLRNRPVGLAALLDDPVALRAQLRAVVQIGRTASVRIMVPMVTAAEEVRTIRAAVDAVAAELQAPPVPVGSMVETVEAVDTVAALCEVADFLSVGTNDLTAQVLDLDRRDPRARPELTAHPYVLDQIVRVVDAGRRAGRPVSVCGDAAAHPLTLPLLLGAGVRAVSVSCARIDETRHRMRRLDTRRCAEVLTEALQQCSADEALALVSERIGVTVP